MHNIDENWKRKIKDKLELFFNELENVCQRCGRKSTDVEVLFATKYLSSIQLLNFVDIYRQLKTDILLIGENRVQEAGEKIEFMENKSPELASLLKLIMIGTLQKNKINKTMGLFSGIHSIDSLDLARALDLRLQRENKLMPIFLEINVSGEENKHGFKPEELDKVIRELKLLKLPASPARLGSAKRAGGLKLEGLMTMAPVFNNPQKTRPIFRKLRELADYYSLKTSMGMSNDWQEAIAEGADIIRVGRRIFSNL